jgi:hypothetical protein
MNNQDKPRDEIAEKSEYWTTPVVNARLRSTFSATEAVQAACLLADLAPAPDCEPEADEAACRLMLAALRVSGGDLRKLALWIAAGREDPRDLIAAAEYGRELARSSGGLDDAAARYADLDEYLEWVGGRG